jgi:hypothetical protein
MLFLTSTHTDGSEVVTAVTMKGVLFWDVTTCNLAKLYGRFGERYFVIFRVEE